MILLTPAGPMATHEHTINDALAEVLRHTRRAWQEPGAVESENTGKIKGSSKRPDILLAERHVSPVVIETEVVPATAVESEAVARLGQQLAGTGRTILSSIAVRLPAVLRTHGGAALREVIRGADDIEMALFTGSSPAAAQRLPRAGWLPGNVHDLSILAQQASVPPDVIDRAANVLEAGINDAAGMLREVAGSHPGLTERIGEALKQEDCEQTRRMAMAIMANALVFHHGLAGGPGALTGVRSITALRNGTGLTQRVILNEWERILKVNYWPIFDIARRILAALTPSPARDILGVLADTADKLVENRLMRSHDLTGAVFQRLIADRKFLAAFYTTPAGAALLSGLAITPASLARWCGGDVTKLRLGDLACGTGTLQSIAYQRVGQLHELGGGDAEAIHPAMMAEGLVGCDVLPAAAHLTASMLAGAHPTKGYDRSSVYTVAYGKRGDRYALGSLDALDPQGEIEYFRITSTPAAHAADPTGESPRSFLDIPHGSLHLVVMNPPFTRPTGHEGKSIGVPNPMFAAFGSKKQDQRRMAVEMKRLTRGTSYSGNAGEASAFLVLANRKVKPDGTLALVMPLSLLGGESWEKSRKVLAKEYEELVVVSVAAPKSRGASFSADTGMGECLVVGRKREKPWQTRAQPRATFVVLHERPAYPLVGAQVARQVRRLIDGGQFRRLEEGPFGGTPIKFGDDTLGQVMDAALPASGAWPLSRVRDMALAQTAYQIATNGRFWLPGMTESKAPAAPVGAVTAVGGRVGPLHRDVEGWEGEVRGPFKIEPASPAPTWPILWEHDAARERTMAFPADCEGSPIQGKTAKGKAFLAAKLERIAGTATHCHVNRDFQFNSQSTAMQYTERRSIGGRAWLSVGLDTSEQEKALVAWGNTTFGLLMYWWHSSKTQTGRGSITKKPLAALPVLDVKKLSPAALASAAEIFDDLRDRALLPVNELTADPVRRELDERFARHVLGFDESALAPGGPVELLRTKLASEPSVHGGKKSRVKSPTGA